MKASDLFIKEGTSQANGTFSSTAVAIVAAASNTKGLIVKTAYLYSSTTGAIAVLVSAASAPGAYNTAGNGIILGESQGTGFPGEGQMLPIPILIPAGRGFYAIAGSAGTFTYFATYDLL